MADNETIFKPEYNLLADAFIGNPEMLQPKLDYLSRIAQKENWDTKGTTDKKILFNYIHYTYDRIKEENKTVISEDNESMCFNTGLLTENGADIYAYFIKNISSKAKPGQHWFLSGFKQQTDRELRTFKKMPEIADYFTNPTDFIFDKKLDLYIDFDHIINDNYDRFIDIGLTEKFVINALLKSASEKIKEKVKRNYKLAIPQYYTDKSTGISKIQLLLPLFLQSKDCADLALVVDKEQYKYVGKTILPLEWAYINSRRIVRPDVDWLKL